MTAANNTSQKRPVLIASDHAGTELKQRLQTALPEYAWIDLGPVTEVERVDYPDYARKLCDAIRAGQASSGVLICGSGVGMSIAANKCKGIRAALVFDSVSAQLAREHNDANVLCLGARVTNADTAVDATQAFLSGHFSSDERHHVRVQKLLKIEEDNS